MHALRDQEPDERTQFKRAILHQIKNEILQRTGWTEINYRELINMDYISMFPTNRGYDIDATIKVAESYIIRYVYNIINKLILAGQSAQHVKEDFERSTEHDAVQTEQQQISVYTERNKVASTIKPAVDELNKRLKSYLNSVTNLPVMNHIVYPNIQYFEELVNWLNIRSLVKTKLQMKREHAAMEHVSDTEETKLQRLIYARTLATKITSDS